MNEAGYCKTLEMTDLLNRIGTSAIPRQVRHGLARTLTAVDASASGVGAHPCPREWERLDVSVVGTIADSLACTYRSWRSRYSVFALT